MFDKKFSIVFPSRERVKLLDACLHSIMDNAANLIDIEILVAVDEDDTSTRAYINSLPIFPHGVLKFFLVKRSLNFSRDYYTYLAWNSTGRWIITSNDDGMFTTKDWDAKAYEVLKDKPGVIYGWIEDNLGGWRAKGHGDYCCFPLQGRKGFEALGYIFPARVPTWGADIWAKNLYDQVGSVAKLPFEISHLCHHNKTRDQDHVSKRIAMNQVPFDMNPSYQEINTLLLALKGEYANKA